MTDDAKCPSCSAPQTPGRVICEFCTQPYSQQLLKAALHCPKCQELSAPSLTKCWACKAELPAPAVEAVEEGDGEEEDESDETDETSHEEDAWACCGKCQALAWDDPDGGKCAAGGKHDMSESAWYVMYDSDEAEGEGDWRFCTKCQALFQSTGKGLKCAAGGKHQADPEELDYVLTTEEDEDGEGGWRWCSKCDVLYFDSEDAGKCAAGGKHEPANDDEYVLYFNEADDEEAEKPN